MIFIAITVLLKKKMPCFQEHIGKNTNFFSQHNKRFKQEKLYRPAAPKKSRVRDLGRLQVLIKSFSLLERTAQKPGSCYC